VNNCVIFNVANVPGQTWLQQVRGLCQGKFCIRTKSSSIEINKLIGWFFVLIFYPKHDFLRRQINQQWASVLREVQTLRRIFFLGGAEC